VPGAGGYLIVEAALAAAIEAEVLDRRPWWEGRVSMLAEELRARRLARATVADLAERRSRR
jgi:hypothetical protein